MEGNLVVLLGLSSSLWTVSVAAKDRNGKFCCMSAGEEKRRRVDGGCNEAAFCIHAAGKDVSVVRDMEQCRVVLSEVSKCLRRHSGRQWFIEAYRPFPSPKPLSLVCSRSKGLEFIKKQIG